MIRFEFRLAGELCKVLPDREPPAWENPSMTLLGNGRGAFQLAYFCVSDISDENDPNFYVSIEGVAFEAVSCRQVCLVPCDYPCHGVFDDNYLTTRPGLLPDLLKPVNLPGPFRAIPGQWRSAWFTVEASRLCPGEYTVALTVTHAGNVEARFNVGLKVSELALPPQTLFHTEWFHADCIADFYGIPVFCERHWRSIDAFMAAAARCGVNMLLTPVFTPPLDTAVGGERTTIQLVDIVSENGRYSFNFDRLRRWIGLCVKNGITELEICHLFTQWGAKYAPKIMVWENGAYVRRFGWDTPAVGGEYTRFLHAFIPALKEELQKEGMLNHTWFHISDEPNETQKRDYLAAKQSVFKLLEGCRVIDAGSSYEFYAEGIVEKPVVCMGSLSPFVTAKMPGLWTYYCHTGAVDVPNRFISMPSARNRILGVLLYVYDMEGFLHWGFNFYNSMRSERHIDPFRTTDGGEAFPSGDPFLVYPAPDGTAWDSIRSETLYAAMQDLRLLRLAESRIGRAQTLNIVERAAKGPVRFDKYPRGDAFFDRLKKELLTRLATA